MSFLKYLSLFFYMIVLVVSCEQLLSSKLCDVCKCKDEFEPVIINCAARYLKSPLENWTSLIRNTTCIKSSHLILTFYENNMKNIGIIPKIPNTTIELSLVNCNLTDIQTGAFKNLKGLHALDMSSNKLTGNSLKGMFREPNKNNESTPLNLEVLNFGNNEIHTLERKIFQYTPKLRSLYLNDNPMRIIDLSTTLAISKATELEVLDLSRTGISSLPDNLFRNLKNLKELYLSGNKLTKVPASLGAISNSLMFLAINENQMNELDENSFLGLWRLERLEASGIRSLTIIKANTFIQLKSLKILYLTENRALSEINHESFLGLKEKWPIKELYLNGNNLRYLPKDLIPWNQTNNINLENNPWTCDCKMALDLVSGLAGKLSKGSNPKCAEPPYMSGKQLKDVSNEHLCPIDEAETDISIYESDRGSSAARYTKSTKILIIFSITILVLACVIVVNIKFRQCRKGKRNVSVAPIRYMNVHSEQNF